MCGLPANRPLLMGTGPHGGLHRRRPLYPPSTSPPDPRRSRTVSTKALLPACDALGRRLEATVARHSCRSYCIPVNNPSHQPSAASLCGSSFDPEFYHKKPASMINAYHEPMPSVSKLSKTLPQDRDHGQGRVGN